MGIISDAAGSFSCTGTLIAPRFVLTAASAVVDGSTGVVNLGQTNGRFILGGTSYHTLHVYANPTYHGDLSQETESALDLAVFELDTAVPSVTPSSLYRQVPTVGTRLTLVGYGLLGTGLTGFINSSPPAGTVNFGYTPIDIVTGTFIKWNFEDFPPPNKESNTAPGDTGCPQFITVGSVLQIASVCSGGIKPNASFGDLGYNTRVDIAAGWIDSIMTAPPTLNSPTYTTNRQFQFNLTGQAGSNYVIQVSTNLNLTNWISLRTNVAPFTFVESNAVSYPKRFYRAKLLQ